MSEKPSPENKNLLTRLKLVMLGTLTAISVLGLPQLPSSASSGKLENEKTVQTEQLSNTLAQISPEAQEIIDEGLSVAEQEKLVNDSLVKLEILFEALKNVQYDQSIEGKQKTADINRKIINIVDGVVPFLTDSNTAVNAQNLYVDLFNSSGISVLENTDIVVAINNIVNFGADEIKNPYSQ